MDAPTRNLLLIAGRLGLYDDGWPIGPFLDRLAAHGYSAQVLCLSAWGEAGNHPQVIESPGLAHRWLQHLAIRSLRPGEALQRPHLVHVVHRSMAEVGLSIAERWRLPYVQTVDEFLAPGERIRVSRRWCRGLIATGSELADDLVRGLAVPRSFVSVIRRGVTMGEEPAPVSREGHVPVIGTAGPLVASSGLVTFLNAARKVIDAGVDAEFVIAGQGEDEVDLRRRAERLRMADRVTFVGLPVLGLRYWNVLDVYCQTSLVPTIGRPLAMALSFEVPSVVSDVQGLRELVHYGEIGLLTPPDDSSALSQAILAVLADRDRARALGAAGRATIERELNPSREAEALAALYGAVLAGGPAEETAPALAS